MPIYYNGDSLNPFVQGVLAGFDVFDRARERRWQAEDRRRAIGLEEARMGLARNQDSRAEAEAKRSEAEFEWKKEQRPGDLEWQSQLRDRQAKQWGRDDDQYAFDLGERNRAARERDEKGQLITDMLSMESGLSPPSDGAERRRGGGPSPRGLRNNNPGNLRATSIPWQGKVGSDGEFEQFATPEDGLRAASLNLATGGDKGANTLRAAISRWAPATENDTNAYISRVSTALGIDPDAPLDLRDPRVNAAVLGQIVGVENGEQPFSEEQLLSITQSALGGAGNTAAGQGGGGSGVVEPAKPRNLREAQAVIDARNSTQSPASVINDALVAGATSVGEAALRRNARKMEEVADPTNVGLDASMVRQNPLKFIDSYGTLRQYVAPDKRNALDQMFMGAAQERLNELKTSASTRRDVAEIERLSNVVYSVRNQRSKDAVDAALPRPAKAGDAPAAALEAGVKEGTAGDTSKTTGAEVRGLNTQMNRLSSNPPQRLSAAQIKRVSRAVELGVITMEQAQNLVRFGRMDAPGKSTVTSLGGGVGVVSGPNGELRVIDFSDAGKDGKGKNGMTLTEERQRHADMAVYVGKQIEGMRENEAFDNRVFGIGKDVPTLIGDFYKAVDSNRSQLERMGFPLTSGAGNTTLAYLSEGELSQMLDWYAKFRTDELDATFPDGKQFWEYGGARTPAGGGWSVEEVK